MVRIARIVVVSAVVALFAPNGAALPFADHGSPQPASAARAHGAYDLYRSFAAKCGDFDCRIPLRWGNRKFGYRHIKLRHGYDRRTEAMIRRVLRRGTRKCQDDFCSTEVWTLASGDFFDRVVVSNRVVRHRRVGIITAYSGIFGGGGGDFGAGK